MKRTAGRVNARSHQALRSVSMLTLFAALAVLTAILVSPAGNFPLNDDWVYGKVARWFAEEGRLALHPFARTYAWTQVVFAVPLIMLFGFSFTVLRVGTIILGVFTAWFVALCGGELGLTRRAALACGMVLFCNPLFMNLSYTFMTEIPFLCCLAASCFFYLRAMRTGTVSGMFWGTVFSVAAFFCRQFGLLSTLAFAATGVIFWREARPHVGPKAVAAILVPWAPAVAGVLWFHLRNQRPFMPNANPDYFAPAQLTQAGAWTLSVALYTGLFVVPISGGVMWALLNGQIHWRRSPWLAACLIGAILAAGLAVDPRPIPRLPNMLRNLGVGPLLLSDVYHPLHPWSPYALNPAVLWVITTASLLSAAICAGALWNACVLRHWGQHAAPAIRVPQVQRVFLLVLAALLLLAPCNPELHVYYDRYVLPAVFPVCLVTASCLPVPRKTRLFRPVAFAWALFFVFSLVCLQDYMAWNRARWSAIESLRTEWHAPDSEIDGGYEFNGMYTSDDFADREGSRSSLRPGTRGWWIVGARYTIGMRPDSGYEIIGRVPYFSWLGFTTRDILMLRQR